MPEVEYTAEQVNLIYTKVRALYTAGEPQKALNMKGRLKAGQYIAPYEYDPAFVWPEKPVAIPGLKPPRRTGPGSSQGSWAQFAIQVSDIEPEVVRAMSRDDIIGVLIERHIIPPEGK
jgi:hypothetical protein